MLIELPAARPQPDPLGHEPEEGFPINLTLQVEDEQYGRLLSRDEVKRLLIQALVEQGCTFVHYIDFLPRGTLISYRWHADSRWQNVLLPMVVPEAGLWLPSLSNRAERRRRRREGRSW